MSGRFELLRGETPILSADDVIRNRKLAPAISLQLDNPGIVSSSPKSPRDALCTPGPSDTCADGSLQVSKTGKGQNSSTWWRLLDAH